MPKGMMYTMYQRYESVLSIFILYVSLIPMLLIIERD